jgi:hypothetical protein
MKVIEVTFTNENLYKDELLAKISIFYSIYNYFDAPKDYLCLFKDPCSTLTTIIPNSPDVLLPLDVPNFSKCSAHCELPNNHHFFYGGDSHTSSVCIIDMSHKFGIAKSPRKQKGTWGAATITIKFTC